MVGMDVKEETNPYIHNNRTERMFLVEANTESASTHALGKYSISIDVFNFHPHSHL